MHRLGIRGYTDVKSFGITSCSFASFSASKSCCSSKYHGSEPKSTIVDEEVTLNYKSDYLNKLGTWSLFICRVSKKSREEQI